MLKIKQLLAVILSLLAMQSVSAMKKNIVKAAYAAPKYALAYGALRASACIAHELAHAIPGQIFFGNILGLGFFGEPKVTIKNEKFFLRIGTNVLASSGCYTPEIVLMTNSDKIKRMIMLASGPAVGAASVFLTKKLLKNSVNKRFLKWATTYEAFEQLSNYVPLYETVDKPDLIVSTEFPDTDRAIKTASDGFKLYNIYKSYKANRPCTSLGAPKE